jgi:3alpha(or 20beta)-hydroxysteroid dehydrogenase
MSQSSLSEAGSLKSRMPPSAPLVKAIPMGREGEPEEVGRVIRFLLSEEASYVTGASIVVDAGITVG